MSDGELRQSVRLAADPAAQIGILAELNGITVREVRAVTAEILAERKKKEG